MFLGNFEYFDLQRKAEIVLSFLFFFDIFSLEFLVTTNQKTKYFWLINELDIRASNFELLNYESSNRKMFEQNSLQLKRT